MTHCITGTDSISCMLPGRHLPPHTPVLVVWSGDLSVKFREVDEIIHMHAGGGPLPVVQATLRPAPYVPAPINRPNPVRMQVELTSTW